MAAKKDKILKNCKNCGNEMLVYPYAIDRKNFCSRSCNCSYNMRGHKHAIGNKNWLGKKHTDQSKEKNRAAHIGKRNSVSTEFKGGLTPWNKGRPFPQIAGENHPSKRPEVAAKIRMAMLGRPAPWHRGENNSNWKGGITPENKKIRTSMEYKQWRTSVFERDGYTCQHCDKVGGELHADHIKPFALYPELRLDINNGRTLCKDCHRKTPTWGNTKMKIAI
jgi:hypothetical protein